MSLADITLHFIHRINENTEQRRMSGQKIQQVLKGTFPHMLPKHIHRQAKTLNFPRLQFTKFFTQTSAGSPPEISGIKWSCIKKNWKSIYLLNPEKGKLGSHPRGYLTISS